MKFYGDHMTPASRLVLALRIDPVHRDDEAGLMRKTWFDYQELDPVQRTYLFAHFYKTQTEYFYAKCIDIRTVEQVRAFAPQDIFSSRDLTAMWLARRAVDAIGVPYDVALEFAQKRALDRLFHRFPRPNQLYGEEFEGDLESHWGQMLAQGLRYSRDERMKVDERHRHRTLPATRHAEFVVRQIRMRPAPHFRLLARMFRERVLAAGTPIIQELFTLEEVEQADDYMAYLG
jgi:hypothetical protein